MDQIELDFGMEPTDATNHQQPLPRKPKSRTMLNSLHEIISDALPAFREPNGVCNLNKLADELSLSKQAVYGWFQRKKIPRCRVDQIIEISKKQGAENVLTIEDIWKYVA